MTQARRQLEQAAKVEPSPKTLFALAHVAHQQKDLQGALGYLAHARDIAPNESLLSYYFGQICIELNLIAEAHKALLQAVTIEPNNAEYNYALGIVATWRHDPSEAIPYLQKYLSLKPADARGQLALGATHFKVKDFESARKELTEAAKNKATNSEAHYYLGRLARQENKLDEAVQELNLTLAAMPNHVDVFG